MILLQREMKQQLKVTIPNNNEEKKASCFSEVVRIYLSREHKESVKDAIREQFEFIQGLQKARRVFKSSEDMQKSLVDELNKISQRHQFKNMIFLIAG